LGICASSDIDEMKILIITDAWEPQVNGVVRTYQNTIKELEKVGNVVKVIHPYCYRFKRVKLPGYPEIELVINPWIIKNEIWIALQEGWKIHIATEGTLGLYARFMLRKNEFTTCYHTQFPEFLEARTKISARVFYPFFRWFHNSARVMMVPTKSMCDFLTEKKFTNVKVWTRGVNSNIFNPSRKKEKGSYILCVSRVSHEKGLDDFCRLNYPRKVLIGDGPYLETLKKKYPDVEFLGKKEGIELAEWYASADAFIFPSKTDTFGIVILEALASGTPVASYWEPGPMETIELMYNGMMSDDLNHSMKVATELVSREDVVESSKGWTWESATKTFLENIK
jgi:glycosyltransferase involved in cell wall biosynthesis